MPLAPVVARLIDTREHRPRTFFIAFLVMHAAVWTLLPSLLYNNLPLDVIEAMTYGREWQLGYDKLPPLPWFMAEIAWRLGRHDDALYALSALVAAAAFIPVWLTARPLIGNFGAAASVLIIDGMHYLNISAVKFNHNTIELPLWALAGYAFHAALRRGSLWHWVLLGLALGAALWAKYFVVILALPLVLYLVADPQARRSLLTFGPWFAAAVALIVMAPHLYWLVQNDFLPFHYADSRAVAPSGMIDHVTRPLEFVIGQAVFLIPSVIIAPPLFWPRATPAPASGGFPAPGFDAFDRRIVTLLSFGPAATLAALSLLTGRGTNAMWGFPLFLFIGLFAVMMANAALTRERLARIGGLWAVVFVIFVGAFIADYLVLPAIDHRYRAAFYPGDRLSAAITGRFKSATGRDPAYIIGSMWDGGNVAHYSNAWPQPRVLIDGLPRRAPWIDLGDLKRQGAAIVWTQGDPNRLPDDFADIAPQARVGTPFDLDYHRGSGAIHVGWAILPPQAP